MKYLATTLALACLGADAALPQPAVVQPVPAGGLRQTLQQYHPSSGSAPRQLTPAEREELRRQLSEQSRSRQRRR